jgi:hypothetical protein
VVSSKDRAWNEIFKQLDIHSHDFSKEPFKLTAKEIKKICSIFSETGEREPRIICYQAERKDRPQLFVDKGLFLLPTKNGHYSIIETTSQSDGYIDIPEITSEPIEHSSKLKFKLRSSEIGNSEMQHVDKASALGLIDHFCDSGPSFLTIRGRKYTPDFSFTVGKHPIFTKSVQTEVDAGYEGEYHLTLIEAKNTKVKDILIRQLYYPYRQWSHHTGKDVFVLLFEFKDNMYHFWEFEFTNPNDYMSINLVKSSRYIIR